MSGQKLTFGDLKSGDLFIGFPSDGDNAGHGGFKQAHVLYRKVKSEILKEKGVVLDKPIVSFVAVRVLDGMDTTFQNNMEVIKII